MEKGWGTQPYQDLLLRLAEKSRVNPQLSVFSTHPLIKERISLLKAIDNDRGF